MEIVIRKAKIGDLRAIQDLATELMLSDKRFDPLLKGRWYFSDAGKRFLIKSIRGRNHVCFVAQVENRLVGYASCTFLTDETWCSGKRAELNEMVVTQRYRRHGVGGRLMAAFKGWSKEKGATKVKVIVHSLNGDGIRFYRDNGFKDYHMTMQADL